MVLLFDVLNIAQGEIKRNHHPGSHFGRNIQNGHQIVTPTSFLTIYPRISAIWSQSIVNARGTAFTTVSAVEIAANFSSCFLANAI